MHSCPSCSSDRLEKRGTRETKSGKQYRQYKCKDCKARFSLEMPKVDDTPKQYSNNKKFVITSYQRNTDINNEFLITLKSYAKYNRADLIVLSEHEIDSDLGIITLNHNFNLSDDLVVYSKLNISPTIENPLAGLDGLSKGKSMIVGHPTLQMKTLPVFGSANPIMIHTTGSISIPNYDVHKKAGAKAEHNHSFSALIVELDNKNNIFHVRVLNASDDGSFYDLDKFYNGNSIEKSKSVEAIILGDSHASVIDDNAYNATFSDKNSIINTLKPKTIVHHDILDFGLAGSHHNKNSFIKRYEKYIAGKDSVVAELNVTAEYLIQSTPDFVENSIVVASNHNDHLSVWLDSQSDKSYDYKNAKIYHYLMYRTLSNIESGLEVNPFKFYFEEYCKNNIIKSKTKFLGREDLYYINDILVSSHGDKGTGGSRFSPTQGKKYPSKMVVGHSHNPSINGGLYTTGTMTGKLDYTFGTPSGWMQTHCVIYPNGKRQLISIINGSWRTN